MGLLDEMLAPPAFAARRLLGPDARLIENELVVLAAWTAAEGPATRAVRIEDRIVDYLTDVDRADARLAGAVRDLALPPMGELAPAQVRLLDALTTAPGARIVFTGGDPRSRRDEAAAIGAQLRMPVLLASAPAVAEPHGPHLVALAFREATLRSALLLWEDCEALFDRGRPCRPGPRCCEPLPGIGGPPCSTTRRCGIPRTAPPRRRLSAGRCLVSTSANVKPGGQPSSPTWPTGTP